MRRTKVMLEAENVRLRRENDALLQRVRDAEAKVRFLSDVASRPDTALITAQRLAESAAALVQSFPSVQSLMRVTVRDGEHR